MRNLLAICVPFLMIAQPSHSGELMEACIAKGRTAQMCQCYEREAMTVADPQVVEFMAITISTGMPPVHLMLASGIDVTSFGDQINALAVRTDRLCFGQN